MNYLTAYSTMTQYLAQKVACDAANLLEQAMAGDTGSDLYGRVRDARSDTRASLRTVREAATAADELAQRVDKLGAEGLAEDLYELAEVLRDVAHEDPLAC